MDNAPSPCRREIVQASGESSQSCDDDDDDDKVYVVVANAIDMTVATALLHWTFGQFRDREICLVHVYQPSSTIPTLLGKLPVNKANRQSVSVFREEERQRNLKLICNYLGICSRSKVKASTITIEATKATQVQEGIIELITRHGIKTLVMESMGDNCAKVKKSHAARNAPPFCDIWFVSKGKHLWTREATGSAVNFMPTMSTSSEESLTDVTISFGTDRFRDGIIRQDEIEVALSVSGPVSKNTLTFNNVDTTSGYTPIEIAGSSGVDSDAEKEMLCSKLIEYTTEAEKAKAEAFAESLELKRLELESAETMDKVNLFEAACTEELRLSNQMKDAVSSIRQEKEKLLVQREEVSDELQRAMRNVAVLTSRVEEANASQVGASRELWLIEASLETLRVEKKKMQLQRYAAMRRVDQWKSRGLGPSCDDESCLLSESEELTGLCLSDLETATCSFSESFKIGQGQYGCVYKGELLDRSVAIKQLYPFKVGGILEFQQEIHVLSKLEHPHLVTLIGACPEAWSLVYEYIPNGSIQDHLFSKTGKRLLPWKTRTRIAAEIASSLLYLHSSKPEKIVHGNLKPENIMLDSDFNCKVGDYGIWRLVPEDSPRCPSFGRSAEPNSTLPYRDPEVMQTSGDVTTKSDIYSFGVIILQLVTGKPAVGLVSEVRRNVLCGKMASILDQSAGEWPEYIARRLVELGLQCCEMNSRDRPELTPTLVRELDRLHLAVIPPFILCPIRQEIMHDPHVAADGFTYEGEAIRGWLKNGCDTSPTTNTKLSHLHLTPNHVLRLAIRDWLCQS